MPRSAATGAWRWPSTSGRSRGIHHTRRSTSISCASCSAGTTDARCAPAARRRLDAEAVAVAVEQRRAPHPIVDRAEAPEIDPTETAAGQQLVPRGVVLAIAVVPDDHAVRGQRVDNERRTFVA